jgi:flagellar basal body-associated protein FliL
MADEKVQQPPANAPDQAAQAEKNAEKGKSKSILPLIIVAVVILVCAGTGIGLGLILAGGKSAQPPAQQETAVEPQAEEKPKAHHAGTEKKADAKTPAAGEIWFFDLDPVVANLNEPGATRYVKATLTLEVSPELNPDKGAALITQKKPLLTNMLTIYLAGLNVESTRGDKNLKRIQSELCDAFNERLFPDGKPMIKGILIKEFAVQ